MEIEYLVYSIEHNAWWAPESSGYTLIESKAGRYSKSEANQIVTGANRGINPGSRLNEIMVIDLQSVKNLEIDNALLQKYKSYLSNRITDLEWDLNRIGPGDIYPALEKELDEIE